MEVSDQKIIITSGYFNPIHIGHINLFRGSRQLGDRLVVIVNNDEQVVQKGSASFMSAQERMDVVSSVRYVDEVFLSVDQDRTVAKSLQAIANRYPGATLYRTVGGDRNISNIPAEEKEICRACGITIVDGVGGEKIQSSSWLIEKTKTQ